jgi:6-phosphogluconolactonase
MASQPQVRVFGSPAELSRAAAQEFCDIGLHAIQERGRFTVALSGGSTPRALHAELVNNFSKVLSWKDVFFFWGDERHVPPDFPESNFRMANETLLSKLPIPHDHIFRMPGELPDANQGAALYEEKLRELFRVAPGEFPRLDFILLGMGPDGHTASLFPGTKALEEKDRLVVGNWVEQHSTYRITLTFPVLNHATNVMFMISGSGEKPGMVRKVLRDPTANLPCQRVQPLDGELMWYLDQQAASKLA